MGTSALPPYALGDPAVLPFVLIPILLALLLLWGVATAWRKSGEPSSGVLITTAVCAAAWMGITWFVADAGILRRWDAMPPPFALFVVGIVLLALRLSMGRFGRVLATGVPLWTLVAVQSFRLPLETAMHALYERGVMPVQMSYSGRNFDIVTGVTALVVAVLVRRRVAGRMVVAAWNVMGLALLVNIVAIALLSTPRIRFFGNDRINVFVTYPPFVWLPAVMVLAALAGHLLVFRALANSRPARP